jgi:hypothetical protein
MLRRGKLLEIAADWASEPPASIAQSKRIGACHPHTSGARFVRRFVVAQDLRPEKEINPSSFYSFFENFPPITS